MKKTSHRADPRRTSDIYRYILLILICVLFIALYTFTLQKSYSNTTLQMAVERNSSCSDTIHRLVSNKLTREDFEEINTIDDMQTERYQKLQRTLNELRSLNDTRYLYTAKRSADGTLVYLIDGLDLTAEDFAYPGTAIEEEVVPYLTRALKGETVYSQQIMDTTWGHIFSACYPVRATDGTGEIIGALCIEIDMESAYRAVEAGNESATAIAGIAAVAATLLMFTAYFIARSQRAHELDQQQKLEEAVEKAESANNAKSTFLFNMSHDIRTPMNAILGYADLARNHLHEPEKLGEYMDYIRISGERLLSIINNVLEFARIENNKVTLDETVAKAGEGLDSCMIMFKPSVEEKHQHMSVTKHILYPYVYIDHACISEVVLNIISNAVKYTPDGGQIRCTLNQQPGEKDGWCMMEISIADTGIGISEEFQAHIFESFSRERSSTVSGIEGTGLGMGIVKKLVDLMGGTIELQSALGKGSTFTVRIPCRIATEEEAKAKQTRYHTDKISVKGRRILLAEDNDLNAEIAMELLREEGLLVERANDGVICVEMLEKAPEHYYDLILMDVQMPIMDGYQATKLIRAMDTPSKANIPIIAMTANAFAEDRKRALAVGMNDHVAKPIDMNALMQVFAKHLQAKLVSSSEPSGAALPPDVIMPVVEELRNSKLAPLLPGGFFAYESWGKEKLLYANEAACAIWGCKDFDELNAFANGSFRGLVHPDDLDRVTHSIRAQVASNERGLDSIDYRIIRKDGSVRWVDDYGHLLKNDNKRDLFYVFVADTTERHQAAAET